MAFKWLNDSLWLFQVLWPLLHPAPPQTFLAWNRAPASGGPSCRYFARFYITILEILSIVTILATLSLRTTHVVTKHKV